jgi:hypothetical protein
MNISNDPSIPMMIATISVGSSSINFWNGFNSKDVSKKKTRFQENDPFVPVVGNAPTAPTGSHGSSDYQLYDALFLIIMLMIVFAAVGMEFIPGMYTACTVAAAASILGDLF